MAQTADNELVKQAKTGDCQVFEFLVSRHERPPYVAAWQLVHNYHDTQDVVQNTFLSATQHLSTFRQGDVAGLLIAFGAWRSP